MLLLNKIFKKFIIKILYIKVKDILMKKIKVLLKMDLVFFLIIKVKHFSVCLKKIKLMGKEIISFGMVHFVGLNLKRIKFMEMLYI